jgi:diguanylate cyclase (GGDEF)-like protein
MPLSFDHLPSLGQQKQSSQASSKKKTGGLSFDSLPSINYAKSDDDIRFKIARGMSSQLFASPEGNARILAEAKQKLTHPVRLLRAESKKIASELPSDFNYKALDPLGILDGQQSLTRFSAAKENKPLKGFAYKDEAENIYNQFDDQNISAAVSKLKSVFPEAGFDKQRPSQVLADARQRFYPELDPTTFMRQMGANPRSKDNPAYVDAEPKELSLGSAMWNAVKTGATAPVAGAVRAYADYTGDENLAKEAQSVTEGTQEDMTDSMRGRSGAGKVAVGIANSAPLMALTYATGGLASGATGVGVGTAAMAAGSGVQKYGSNRAEGFSVADSAKNAAVTGVAEGAFEALPLGSFLKTTGKGLSGALKKVGTQAGTEATSEALTSVAQDVADYKMLGKELTGDSLLNNAIDSAIVGGVMGAGFGSVAALRDSVKRKTNTGDIDVDSGAEVAKTAVQQKLLESVEQQAAQSVIKSKLADIAKPELEANKIAAPAPQNAMDDLLLGQAQADFDRVAKRELDLLRESVGNASVGLDASQVNSIANGIAEKWGVDASSILGVTQGPQQNPDVIEPTTQAVKPKDNFAGVASSLGTNPQQMLADSRVNADVVAQPESEADDVSIGESAIHGNGLIANRNLDSSSGVTLALGANRTEAGQVVNHSDTPNTNVAIVDGVSTAVPVAPIERGEELTINYQKDIPRIRAAANAQTAQPSNLINQQQDQRIDFGGRTNDVAEFSAQISNIRNAAKNRMLKTSEKNKIAELTGAINAINQEVTNDAGQYGPGNREPSNSIEVEKNVVPGMDQSLRQSNSFEAGEQQATQQLGVEQGSQGQAFAVPPVTNNVAVDDPISFLQSENEKLRADAEKYRAEARSNDITRLPNRRQFDDDFLARPSRAVAAIDMDGLKALNDSVGHKAADAVLAKLGEHLRSAESRGGRAYHLSGDEFAVSFDDPDSAQQVMAELQEQLDNVEVTIDTPSGQYVYRGIGVSFGVGENYAKADESAKSDKQRRLESGKREDARASGGQSLPAPRRLIPVAQGSDINNLQGRDVQNTDDGQAGQVEQQQAPQTQQVSGSTTWQSNRVRMTRDQVRSDIANNLGKNVASKLERQPWFNVVDSVDQLPESAIKSIDDAQNVQGFVLPDGSVYIVAGNIDQNATGVVLHEVGVHYGMRGVLGKDFAPVLERFKSLRQANKKVQAAYDSVPGDTQDTNLDEEALAYYVEDNWGSKAPLMQRITDAIKAFANRLGIPLSKLNASPELLVQIAKGATKKAASGRVRFNGGDTMRSTRNSYPASLPIQTITKPEMLRRGADGNVNTAKERYIPLNKIDGLEPTPAASDEEGYRKGREITQPIEVVYSKSDDTYYLYSGNHRVTQAKINGDSHIRAFVQPDRGDVGPSATAILSETNLGVARSPDEMSEFILLDGVLRSTTNSNGQSIAETEEGVRNFWRWFGDSKVVDADGRPMVVYHGTSADFSAFDMNFMYSGEGASQSGSGFYFTSEKDSASGYAGVAGDNGRVMPVYLAINKPLPIDFSNGEVFGADIVFSKAQVKKIILAAPKIRSKEDSPLLNFGDIEFEGFATVLNQAINSYAGGNNIAALRNDFFQRPEDWLKALKSATGFDSAISVTREGEMHFVAWSPTQIKSATGNSGEFSPENPDIRYSKRRTPVNEIVAQDNSDNRGGLVGVLDSAKKLIEAPYKSATDKLRRSKVGRPLADAIDKFYDNRSRRVGEMDSILRPVTKEATKGDLESFKTLMAHLQNARVKEFRQGFSEATKNVKDMFAAWQKVADTAGEENQSIGVKVFDEKINQWRPIGRVKGIFWPRAVKKKYHLAMMNPEKYAKEWAEMVDILKGSGRISSIEEAEKYLNTQFRNESSDDYFAGIEKARTDPMPEELYDYSWEQAIKYKDSWAERISQIEAFGQKGPSGEDLFDKTLNSTLNKTTRDHVARIRDGIFRVNSNRIINQWLQTFSSVLTGLQLGNPASSIVNLVGGLTLTAQSYPARYWVKGLLDLYKLGDAVNQAYNTGVLADDYLGVAADNQYDGVPDWVSKGTSALLNYGGFTPAERFVRSHNMLVAKSFLRDSIKAWNKNITSRKSKLAIAWLQRNGGFDYRTLLIENGAGKETDRFIRKAVNETQGSYKLDQIPMFTDEPLGKFLLKYQKFGFQVIRMFTKNHLEPFMASLSRGEKVTYEINGKVVEDRVRNFIPLLRYFVAAIPGGLITEYLRSALFGYLSSGPDDEEIKKALADTENAKAMGLLIERGVSSVVSMGALGFVGNYGQSLLAWQDRQRYKNPLNPPGISVINSIAGLLQKGLDQGQLTWRDAHEFTQQQWSLYRTSAKLTESGFELFAPDSSLGKSTQADRDRKWVRKMARRYADEAGIEAKTRAPEEPVFTENTPMNTNIKLALLVGDAERAKQIAIEAMKGKKTAKEIDSLKLSIAGSIRAYRPALVSQSSSMVESKRFMLWAKKNLTAERYARLERIDSAYMDAAKRSGIWNWKDVKVDSDMGKLRVLSPAEIDAYIRRKIH